MSSWFSRAKEALSGRAAPREPEPIELACPCGRKIPAQRRESFQRVLCKACGEPFFILPFDVYPRPVLKKVRSAKPNASERPVQSDSPVAKTITLPRLDLNAIATKFRQRVRAVFTPLRLVTLCLLSVIVVTGWWQWNRAVRSAAEADFKQAWDEGFELLKKKEYVNADIAMQRAAQAADVLNRHDSLAEQARQRHRELWALNNALLRTPLEILQTARDTAKAKGPAAAESEFLNLNTNRWLILSSDVSVPQAGADSTSWEQVLQLDSDKLAITTELPALTRMSAPASDPAAEPNATPGPGVNDLGQREVFFAARVDRLTWDAAASVWRLSLQADSAFFWSDFELLLAAGFAPDELRTEQQLRSMLAEQSRWIGVSE